MLCLEQRTIGRLLSAILLGLLLTGSASAADKHYPVGEVWEGTLRLFRPGEEGAKRFTSGTSTLKITGRKGDEFTAELNSQNGNHNVTVEIQGIVTSNGAVKATMTRMLKGDAPAPDLIGRVKMAGMPNAKGVLNLDMSIPNGGRRGKLTVTRKADQK
jgi:hypothetical protein